MKSTSQGTVRCRIRSAMKKTAPLRTPISSRSRPCVVGGDLVAELGDPRGSVSASIRISPTAALELGLAHSTPLRVTPGASTIPGTATTSSPAHDERPGLALGPRDLRVDEHVLELLPAARRAGRPGASSAPRGLRARTRSSRGPSGRGRERDRVCSSETRSYSRTALRPLAEVERASCRRSSRAASSSSFGGRVPRRGGAGSARRAGWSRRRSGRSSSRIRPRSVSGFEESLRNVEAFGAAVGLGLLAPEREQRADDAVLAPRLDPPGASRSRRAGRGRSRPGRRRCGRSRAADPVASE